VIIGRKGTLGTVFYSAGDFWPHDTTLWVKDFHGNDEKYAYFFLQTMGLEQYDAGASNPTLNRNHIHLLPIRCPPVAEQRRIADILSAYDDLIENNTRRIAILEEMARAIYREWFVDFRFPGHEQVEMVESELGPLPAEWEVKSFAEVADVLSGGTPKTTIPDYWDGAIPFFTPKDAPSSFYVLSTEKSVTEEGLRKCSSRLYPKDAVFITARGTVGKVALPAEPMAMNQSCYALQGLNGIDQLFVFFSIRQAVAQLQQRAHGAVFDTIIMDTFRRLRVIKPPPTVIDTFVQLVRPIVDHSLILSRKNAVLRETRDLLLPKLISGEIEVPAAEDALAGAVA
jgi:type I restriction enzyme S subunit